MSADSLFIPTQNMYRLIYLGSDQCSNLDIRNSINVPIISGVDMLTRNCYRYKLNGNRIMTPRF